MTLRCRVVAGVHVVAGGEALLAPAVTKRLIEEFARRPPFGDRPVRRLKELAPREQEVLELIARGRTNPEIGAELCVNEATVKSHVTCS